MRTSVPDFPMGLGIAAVGVVICVAGICIGETDDAPGASLIGILLIAGAVALGARTARRKTPSRDRGAPQWACW